MSTAMTLDEEDDELWKRKRKKIDATRISNNESFWKIRNFVIILSLAAGGAGMAVMMQAFYWDAPKHENRNTSGGTSSPSGRSLGKAGFNALWLPPVSKASSIASMGYDPYDYFDLGDFDQKGGTKTWYGNAPSLEGADRQGAQAWRRPLRRHGDQPQLRRGRRRGQPARRPEALDQVQPKSGISPRLEPLPSQPLRAGDDRRRKLRRLSPSLPSQPRGLQAAMFEYARMLIEELGFDGFRFDFVKGFGAWMIGLLAKYRYVKDGKEFTPYVVGEYWSGGRTSTAGSTASTAMTDNQIAPSTFPCATS
jgi:alpha-amylase